jgi:hypothetical protein
MMRFILASLFVLAQSFSAFATTYINSPIEADTRWTKSNSPYILTTDIKIMEGATLEIEPGTKVYFAAETKMIVDGGLRAIGKKSKKIIFTGHNDASWNGFLLNRSCEHYNEENQSGTIFKYCSFKGVGEAPAQLIRTKGCNLRVEGCIIEDCYTAIQSERQARIEVENSKFKNCNRPINVRNTSMAKIISNKMEDCNSIMLGGTTEFKGNVLKKFSGKGRHSGVIVWMLGGGIIDMEGNRFLKFEDYALKLQKMSRRSTLNLKGNIFKDNTTNLKLSCKYYNRGNIAIENNNFFNCNEYHVRLFSPCSEEEEITVEIGANYWGKISEDELKNVTFDKQKDGKLTAKVNFEKVLPSKAR